MENWISRLRNTLQGAIEGAIDHLTGNEEEDAKDNTPSQSPSQPPLLKELKMHNYFNMENDITNGLCFNNVYLPQEIVTHILSFVPSNKLLGCALVCKQWHNLIKSTPLWQEVYNRLEYPKKAPNYPWYIFYSYFCTKNFTNLLKNGNGQNDFRHWNVTANGGDGFKIESTPCGAPPLPLGIPDFQGRTSCFSTSFEWCSKVQQIRLSKLSRYIVQKHKPTIYASEWYNGRFDCASEYAFSVRCLTPQEKFSQHEEECGTNTYVKVEKTADIEQWANKDWEKLEITVDEYNPNIDRIMFSHAGKDRQFWKGHYGSKMAGGVVKFLLENIRPETKNFSCGDDLEES